MKYTLGSINQVGIVESGLENKTDVVDWCILDYIFDWKDSPKAHVLNGMVWLSYSHFIKEMPILGIKDKGAISRRIKKLKELGLIETYQSPDDMRLYAKTTAFYYGITKFQASSSTVDLKQHPLTSVNTPVDLKQHPVDERQHSTVILNNSNTIEQKEVAGAQPTKPEKQKKQKQPFVIPESINPIAWQEFEQHRVEIKKPLTDLGRLKASNLLVDRSFDDQQFMVDYSINGKWSGLFPDCLVKKHQQKTPVSQWKMPESWGDGDAIDSTAVVVTQNYLQGN